MESHYIRFYLILALKVLFRIQKHFCALWEGCAKILEAGYPHRRIDSEVCWKKALRTMYRRDNKKEKKEELATCADRNGAGPRKVPLFISLHTRYPRPWEKLQAERPMSNNQCRWLSNRLAVPIDPSKRASLLVAATKNKFANISAMKKKREKRITVAKGATLSIAFILDSFLHCENMSEGVQ